MHIISAYHFPLFCSNFARKCLILPAECSLQKSFCSKFCRKACLSRYNVDWREKTLTGKARESSGKSARKDKLATKSGNWTSTPCTTILKVLLFLQVLVEILSYIVKGKLSLYLNVLCYSFIVKKNGTFYTSEIKPNTDYLVNMRMKRRNGKPVLSSSLYFTSLYNLELTTCGFKFHA